MSLFGFGDIDFNKNKTTSFGPLAALEGPGAEFKNNAFRYPLDVGSTDKGHYMVFYISMQNTTSFRKGEAGPPPSGALNMQPGNETYWNAIAGNEITSKISADASKIGSAISGGINSVKSGISSSIGGLSGGGGLGGLGSSLGNSLSGLASGVKGKLNSLFGQTAVLNGNTQSTQKIVSENIKTITSSSFLRTTSYTSDCIALYMPDTLMFNHTQSFTEMELAQSAVAKAAVAGASSYEAFKNNEGTFGDKVKAALSQGGGQLATQIVKSVAEAAVDENAAKAGLALLGKVENPLLEMLYQKPNFRTFQFDFMFYPRSEQEALEVQKILERFRFHQAPEFSGNGKDESIFLVPPSEFDIKFYYGAGENPNIPRIAPKCVLETIDINYAPNGWSSYEVQGENIPTRGRTGMPTAIQLTLQFKETTYLTKRDFMQD